ncbi:hypothetical protein [Pseudanabaena sp. FACHB-2040]|uniref:hypothetical protein n=1 Tax=Pseudanabaena sp. FACHB-2040 TaxID=2692859 RepID=UPI0016840645|nr:hypothetical protein [Pseudanabaena sp. FACHB-2040]MBD2260801.1 hypothetical protein [Pseudanabaena sp. FACHB-2040]
MSLCTTPGCDQSVAKSGYTLCYTCWKAKRPVEKATIDKPIIEKPVLQKTVKGETSLETSGNLLSTTRLGEHFGLSRLKVNPILAELGLLDKAEKGWVATPRGLALGAQQKDGQRGGTQYVVWSPEVLDNRIFLQAVKVLAEGNSSAEAPEKTSNFREKFQEGAKYRTNDGHWVRSKAEVLIDNWLYFAGLAHAYERKLPVEAEKDAYCDFYIPQGRIYIEYWGYENEAKYLARKEEKRALYKANELRLIELTDQHIQNLDDHLPTLLRKFGICNID